MLQLYKQVFTTTDYTDFDLSEEQMEMQRVVNERFEQPDVIDELYETSYQTPTKEGGKRTRAIDILDQLGLKGDRLKYYRNEICRVLRKNNIKQNTAERKYLIIKFKKSFDTLI